MFNRPLYYEKIKPFIGKPFIKIISGIRRCGKSTMMLLIQQLMADEGVKREQIISINFESMKYYHLRSSIALYEYVSELVKTMETPAYLFFDEIQIVKDWEEAVNSLFLDFQVDVYITGSNSQLLSSELSTLLTGRCIHIQMQVLSFTEMLTFRSTLQETQQDLLWLYIRRGGFPAVHLSIDYDEKATYMILNDIFDSIVLRDVVQRYKIRDVELLRRILNFIADSVGSTISAKRIADYFKSQARSVDMNTVYTYLDALVSSFLITRVQRYDIQGKELLKTQEKYYLADTGLQHAVFGYKDRHISGILENIVYNELVRRGYTVYIGKLGTQEVDFVAEQPPRKLYVQVAFKLESEETVQREFAPLLAIRDSYPKFVVTMDQNFHDTLEGVQHIGLHQFLTDEKIV
ncbi:putative ATPase (AAA+ superfamily) [Sphaerochaeta pleomorpha str. Grapes]|uniref:Putative ATPase (AAA+ superfamily) n=1 Tax=Sphaerochaeta pleomorpha (strain ATCC BAA-1885 / DSM 22778 / Grapes) TaxID=158190 RepID=G8QWD8_SPHPG|nr:ATP-binding protein [Sphaerochaeta pleomorpha]AEV29436.1 putative ATPase (AAA+ superfamily) [Sphaerochaeta pleomorpha str. Grapes]